MELDDLQKIWNAAEGKTLQPAEVTEMLENHSQNYIEKMRRNLLIELVIVLISVLVVAIFYFYVLNGRLQEVAWLYLGLSVVFIGYYYAKNRLLKSMLTTSHTVRNHLTNQLAQLERYTRYYTIAGVVLVPVLMLIFFSLLSSKQLSVQILGVHSNTLLFKTCYFGFTALLTLLLYFFNRWSVQVLYGKYIQQLKQLNKEINEA